ncbi:MAG: hypothetical protein HUU29_14310 [Planctomycetaceae bacterium]|nr:hypothetical protein [Planctomycetaceae bacterium]
MNPQQQQASLEQITFNNTVSIEALLDALMKKGVITEQDFFASRRVIEEKIVAANQNAAKK